jgi:hypothetical protein
VGERAGKGVNLLLGFGHGVPFGGGPTDVAGEFIGALHLLDGLEIFNVEDRPPVAGSLRVPIVADCNGHYPTPAHGQTERRGEKGGKDERLLFFLGTFFFFFFNTGLGFVFAESVRLGLGLTLPFVRLSRQG